MTRRLLEIFGAKDEDLDEAENGVCEFEDMGRWNGDISIRDLADAITLSGEGEYFDVTYTLDDLREKKVELAEDLERNGIPSEIAA